jgi:hypothetical protein
MVERYNTQMELAREMFLSRILILYSMKVSARGIFLGVLLLRRIQYVLPGGRSPTTVPTPVHMPKPTP